MYGPIQFDDGPGTPITAVQSWMQYKAIADAAGHPLLNVFDGDAFRRLSLPRTPIRGRNPLSSGRVVVAGALLSDTPRSRS